MTECVSYIDVSVFIKSTCTRELGGRAQTVPRQASPDTKPIQEGLNSLRARSGVLMSIQRLEKDLIRTRASS